MSKNFDPVSVLPVSMDIYLLDQVMKYKVAPDAHILDAGCGSGRNLHWFIQNHYMLTGVDIDPEVIKHLKYAYPKIESRFQCMPVESLAFRDEAFHYIISSAVLHFAQNESHFFTMVQEMWRVLKPGGTLFVRMACSHGLEEKTTAVGNGRYLLPDSSTRFLLTSHLLEKCIHLFNWEFIEPFKVVNVNNQRCMCTLVVKKLD